jgi:outer membrane protein assembly factor BamD (BamD/ComL family)
VQRAERAIRNRDPALALSLLGELDRQHPAALLGEERTAARVMANCQAQEPTASLAAERFLRESPNSVYSDRVRALCGLAAPDRKLER